MLAARQWSLRGLDRGGEGGGLPGRVAPVPTGLGGSGGRGGTGRDVGGAQRRSWAGPAPNHGVQATAYSLRSFFAPASGSA